VFVISSFGVWDAPTTSGNPCGSGQCIDVTGFIMPCYRTTGQTALTIGNGAGFTRSPASIGNLSAMDQFTFPGGGTYDLGVCARRSGSDDWFSDFGLSGRTHVLVYQ
jgi:hypothetical protein